MAKKPVLFVIFNRPDTTEKVFSAIAQYQPRDLYIAADGPRPYVASDKDNCRQTRKIIENINWNCNIYTKFNESNKGCRNAVSKAIDWFFQSAIEGIILEDDCCPAQDFFYFCEEMLNKYRNEKRAMHIGGANFHSGRKFGDASFYVSTMPHVWGWATWKRAWDLYDVDLTDYPTFKTNYTLKDIYPDSIFMQWRFNQILDKVYHKSPYFDTWDYQWNYTLWKNNGFALNSNFNLVKNIGLKGTHNSDDINCNLDYTPLPKSLVFPEKLIIDTAADKQTFEKFHKGSYKDYLRFVFSQGRKIFFNENK